MTLEVKSEVNFSNYIHYIEVCEQLWNLVLSSKYASFYDFLN